MVRDAAAAMDRMYRHQRHVYDLTRKFYLIGRDRLLDRLAPNARDQLCEIGCGTARNLIRLARRHPGLRLFGVDASAEMLRTAQAAVGRAGLAGRITLARCLATELDPVATFKLDRPFDGVICSYSLSMMTDWRAALLRALLTLRPGGRLDVVDFWVDDRWPGWLRRPLLDWLALFDVIPRPEIADTLRELASRGNAQLSVEPVLGGYAFQLTYRRSA